MFPYGSGLGRPILPHLCISREDPPPSVAAAKLIEESFGARAFWVREGGKQQRPTWADFTRRGVFLKDVQQRREGAELLENQGREVGGNLGDEKAEWEFSLML